MSKFLYLYLTPAAVLETWMQKDPEERKAEEEKMGKDWEAWMEKNGSQITETAGAGKTKRVTLEGITDVRNDVMMYSLVEAESPEAAAEIFLDHPHLQIPQATIEIMAANSF
jgi:hypothetical protein